MTDHFIYSTLISIKNNLKVQLLGKLFTFFLNAFILSYLPSSSIVGIINVRLALLYTTLQFLPKEAFRKVCIGEASRKTSDAWPSVVNTIWLGYIPSLISIICCGFIWRAMTPSSDDLKGTTPDDYLQAVLIICCSIFVEMLSEPGYTWSQANSKSIHNASVEMMAITTKCIFVSVSTLSSYFFTQTFDGIVGKIALCQLTSSIISVIYTYYRLAKFENLNALHFLPRKCAINRVVSNFKLVSVFVLQGIVKQFLTEGERYVMTFFDLISLKNQGVYDIISNLSSLPARLIFRPIELAFFTLFSQLITRNQKLEPSNFERVQRSLLFMIRVMIILGLVIFIFGHNYVYLISFYGGGKLDSINAFYLMKWQLIYIPLIALNGITECFTSAALGSKAVLQQTYYLVIFSIIYLGSIYATSDLLSDAAFIFANCINMSCRIAFSWKVIQSFFDKHGYHLALSQTFPTSKSILAFVMTFFFLKICSHFLASSTFFILLHLTVGVICLIIIGLILYRSEKDIVEFIRNLYKREKLP